MKRSRVTRAITEKRGHAAVCICGRNTFGSLATRAVVWIAKALLATDSIFSSWSPLPMFRQEPTGKTALPRRAAHSVGAMAGGFGLMETCAQLLVPTPASAMDMHNPIRSAPTEITASSLSSALQLRHRSGVHDWRNSCMKNADVNSIADLLRKQISNIKLKHPLTLSNTLDFQKHRTLGLDHGYRLYLRDGGYEQ